MATDLYRQKLAEQDPAVRKYCGELELTIISAKDLAAKANPYVKITVFSLKHVHPAENHGKTSIAKNTKSPEWGEKFRFTYGTGKSTDDLLLLEVWGHNSVRNEKFLGHILIPVSKMAEDVDNNLDEKLRKHLGKYKDEPVSGRIQVNVRLLNNYFLQRCKLFKEAKDEDSSIKEQEAQLAKRATLGHETTEAIIKAFRERTGLRSGASITRKVFVKLLESLDEGLQKAIEAQVPEPDILFDMLDVHHDNRLDLEEVVLGLSTMASGSLEEKASLVFMAMDTDGSGTLNREELKEQYKNMLACMKKHVKREVVDWVWRNKHIDLGWKNAEKLAKGAVKGMSQAITLEVLLPESETELDLNTWKKLVLEKKGAKYLVSPELFIEDNGPELLGVIEKSLDEELPVMSFRW